MEKNFHNNDDDDDDDDADDDDDDDDPGMIKLSKNLGGTWKLLGAPSSILRIHKY